MSLRSLMRHRVTVRTLDPRRDDSAGTLASYADRLTNVPARIDGINSAERAEYLTLGLNVTHRVYLTRSVTNGEMIVSAEGEKLRIVGVTPYRAAGGIESYYAADCEQVIL